jgi:hypothetical protein
LRSKGRTSGFVESRKRDRKERPDIRVSSNSKAVKDSDEFRALASLGPKVGEQHSGQRQQEIRDSGHNDLD